MKLIRYTQNQILSLPKGVAATIGNFDGLHQGHQALISALKEKAKAYGYSF